MSKKKCDCKELAKLLDDVASVISDVDWLALLPETGLSDEEVEAISFGALAALTSLVIVLCASDYYYASRIRTLSAKHTAAMIMHAGIASHRHFVVDKEEDEPGDRDASGVRVAVEFRG